MADRRPPRPLDKSFDPRSKTNREMERKNRTLSPTNHRRKRLIKHMTPGHMRIRTLQYLAAKAANR